MKPVKENDVITIDLSPSYMGYWGDFARTIILENGVTSILSPSNVKYTIKEIEDAKIFLNYLHSEYPKLLSQEKAMNDIYEIVNSIIRNNGFENLDFARNIGHSIEKLPENRRFFDSKSNVKLKDIEIFTFEPHVRKNNGNFGFKREDIYFKSDSGYQML